MRNYSGFIPYILNAYKLKNIPLSICFGISFMAYLFINSKIDQLLPELGFGLFRCKKMITSIGVHLNDVGKSSSNHLRVPVGITATDDITTRQQ